ncbi:uncharacterized protein MCYG_05973 [Microsporum canis CBS 113480]|uniref:Uncharacterized protein n=1 Tax=Arthroderma otae (strain ATCC MYA-4605 / CBS 113480) TaxID=554155 RepID=C5FTF1_ARTOC|nr:uncharacterized protein MCYG_05973 [Microsporum canis CBS 113480]EEQ33154.1 predicted protein [Microsporum canis CBS 113480]
MEWFASSLAALVLGFKAGYRHIDDDGEHEKAGVKRTAFCNAVCVYPFDNLFKKKRKHTVSMREQVKYSIRKKKRAVLPVCMSGITEPATDACGRKMPSRCNQPTDKPLYSILGLEIARKEKKKASILGASWGLVHGGRVAVSLLVTERVSQPPTASRPLVLDELILLSPRHGPSRGNRHSGRQAARQTHSPSASNRAYHRVSRAAAGVAAAGSVSTVDRDLRSIYGGARAVPEQRETGRRGGPFATVGEELDPDKAPSVA